MSVARSRLACCEAISHPDFGKCGGNGGVELAAFERGFAGLRELVVAHTRSQAKRSAWRFARLYFPWLPSPWNPGGTP
jgi:hypothetical protein